jgi:hypothetical protein
VLCIGILYYGLEDYEVGGTSMLHKTIFERYAKIFTRDVEDVEVWHPNGFGSVRIRFRNKEEYVFSYVNDSNWRYETLDNFIKSMVK